MELAVQQVFSKILGTLCPSGAATVIVLYSGADIFDPADAQHPFIIDIDAIIMTEIVIQSPVTFIRVFQMNLFNLVGQFLILRSPVAQLPAERATWSSSQAVSTGNPCSLQHSLMAI